MRDSRETSPTPGVRRAAFGVADGQPAEAFTLTSASGVRLRFTSIGGIILSLEVPDREGRLADVTPGYDRIEDYARDPRYFGAIVGRYANRIARGRFVLDGVEHQLPINDGRNHLHGGPRGFNARHWRVEPFERGESVGARLSYQSADGEEGYPGRLEARVRYTLTGSTLAIDYEAETDRATPVNLTQHAYFNLGGHDRGDILDHELALAASRFTPTDAELIPTGELRAVRATPFDFTTPRRIGERIDAGDEQLRHGGGYDHNFVIDRSGGDEGALVLAARLRDPSSGRTMEVHTTEPGIQLYTGNVMAGGPVGKGGHDYARRGALALETQHFPDSPNHPEFPSTILRPGATYRSRTEYRFG